MALPEDKAMLIADMRQTAMDIRAEAMLITGSSRGARLKQAAQLLVDADEFERKFQPPIVISFVTGQNQIPLAYPII